MYARMRIYLIAMHDRDIYSTKVKTLPESLGNNTRVETGVATAMIIRASITCI